MIKVGFIQFNCLFGEKEHNIEKVSSLLDEKSADLWVLPELFSTGYLFTSEDELKQLSETVPEGKTASRLIELSGKHNTAIVASLAEKSGDVVFLTNLFSKLRI